MKTTIIKTNRNKETLSRAALQDVVQMIRDGSQRAEVERLREVYPFLHPKRCEDGRVEVTLVPGVQLPRVCFAAEYEMRSGEQRMLKYNGLVVLEVNNLATTDEAVVLRNNACLLPQTLLAFVGASGHSVKIVCRGERPATAGSSASSEMLSDIEAFHRALYEKVRRAYSAQLEVSIESLLPRLDRTVYLSVDADLYWNEQALPFYISQDVDYAKSGADGNNGRDGNCAKHNSEGRDAVQYDALLPGRSLQRTWRLNYLFILEQVLGRWFDLPDESRQAELLMQLATRCMEEGVPMAVAQAMTLQHPALNTDDLLVHKTFQAVYTVEHLKTYQEKHKFRPLKSIPDDTLLMMKTEAFLNANYEMRKNMMTGVAQYRERNGESFDFRDLDQEVRNDMTIRAKEMGLKSWDKDIDRFIDSTRITKYDPVNDYLDHLPRWDGHDRIAELAARVPTKQPHWERYFRTWLLGMVAHWMGRSRLTGNALVPLLIGRQGCGKSSFCRILLPPELRDYYNDRISFKNETDLNLGLTSFALINIDEFDKVTQRQQVLLKYLLSTADVKFRPPYGKAMKQYRRYASFIGTTNELKPLTDPTGSRRFVCAEVTGDIDFSDTIDHRQLYAQLRQQVQDGMRYWLDDEETATLISENERFQRINALEEMVAETFRCPASDEGGRWWSVKEIADCLQQRYRPQDTRNMTLTSLGRVLNIPHFHFESKRRGQGMAYWLAERVTFILCLLTMVLTSRGATIGEERPVGKCRPMVNLTLTDGLAGETVRRIMTDHNGLVWIATTGGINIFDGKHLQPLRIQNEKGHNTEVCDLCETRDGTVYAATERGLFQLKLATERFEQILPEVKSPISLMAAGDTVYIGSEQGLQYWDGKKLHHQDIGLSRQGLDNIVRYYQQDEKGRIWFLGRHSLNSYDPKTGKIKTYDLIGPMEGTKALTQFAVVQGKFFIGTRGSGLYVYESKTGEVRYLNDVGQQVTAVSLSADGYICVATDGTGAFIVDSKTEQVVKHYNIGVGQLPTNALYSFYRDKHGINWFGTVRCGLVYKPHNSRLFKVYEPDGLSTLGMNVRSFCIRDSQSVIGLQDGLWFVDVERHVRRFFTAEEMGGHIVNNIVWWQGYYYIGLYDGGVRVLDPQRLTLSHQSFSPLLSKNSVGKMVAGPDGCLWIGCSDGLFIIPPATAPATSAAGTIRHFTEQNSHIIGGIIIDITFDCDGNAWLSGAKGLSLYSAASRDVVATKFPEGFWNKEPYMRGCSGKDGTVYMRNGPQLFYTRNKMSDFGEIKLPLLLSDKWCRSMQDDGMGHLLLASERGLLHMNSDGAELAQMGEGEGLLGKQISELWLDNNERLWVATSNGLFTAVRNDFDQWLASREYKIMLYPVRKGSDLLTPREMSIMVENRQISLSWNFTSQVLQAEPILVDFAPQQGRLYEYRVDGGEWQQIDNGQSLDVRRLLLGHHTLTVRMMGVKGTETTWQLLVTPSVWAWLELFLFVTAVVALWLWWRYRKYTKEIISEHQLTEQALIEESEKLRDESLELREEGGQKYQKVKIDEAECADIVKRMKEYLEREHVYTNADLKMKDLADVLHLSAPKLSQVFNLYLGENYYDFINRYRLDEFKRLITAGKLKQYTITALSEQCGFKKSNFFSTFRKVEGLTPAEYLKKQGIKV